MGPEGCRSGCPPPKGAGERKVMLRWTCSPAQSIQGDFPMAQQACSHHEPAANRHHLRAYLPCHTRKWPCVGRVGHTHRGGLVPKEVDGVKSLIIEHVEAVALVPALWEDVKADHATCQQKGWHQATMVGTGRVSPNPEMGRRRRKGWMSVGSPQPKQQPGTCSALVRLFSTWLGQ